MKNFKVLILSCSRYFTLLCSVKQNSIQIASDAYTRKILKRAENS